MGKIHLIGETKKEKEEKLLKESLDLIKDNGRLSEEVRSATSLIWAMAKTAGGEVRIRDDLMASMEALEASLSCCYDAENRETVVKAVTNKKSVN